MARLFEDDMSGVLGPNPENAISSPVPSQSGGIGIAREDPFKAEYAKMSGPQEFFSRLGEFGAGVTGRPSPMQARIDSRRKDKMLQMEETKGLLADLENLTKITEGMDDAAKSGLIDTVAKKWEAVQPGYGDAVKTVGARPTLLKGFEQYLPHLPAPMQQLAKRDPRAFLKLVGTKEGAKMLNDAADQPALRLAGRRRDAVIVGWQQLVPKELADKLNADGVLTDAEVMEIQDKLPEKLRFTDEEKDAIKRSKGMFWEGSGVLHGDKAQEVLADRAKKAGDKDLKSGKIVDLPLGGKEFAKGAYDPDGKLFPDAEHDKNGFAILGKGTKEGVSITFPTSSGFGVNPDTGKEGHYSIGKDGTIRWDKVQKSPKEQDPIKAAIAAAMKGEKPKEKPLGPESEADVGKRFKADPAMKGNTLGAKTDKGFEVKNKSGRVVGYYR